MVYTFQALSEDDLQLWLDAMDGKEPMYEHPPRPSDANQTYLDEVGFTFVQRCFQVLECRGKINATTIPEQSQELDFDTCFQVWKSKVFIELWASPRK